VASTAASTIFAIPVAVCHGRDGDSGAQMAERVLTMGGAPSRIVIDPGDVDNPILAFGLVLWRRARQNRMVPRETDFSSRDLSTHAESLTVCEALPGMNDFRYRFVGDKVKDYFRGAAPDRTLREIFAALDAAALDGAVSLFRTACEEKVPVRITSPRGNINDLDYADFDALYLPFSSGPPPAMSIVSIYTFNYEQFRRTGSVVSLFPVP